MPALLSIAPWKELLEITEYGIVWDGQWRGAGWGRTQGELGESEAARVSFQRALEAEAAGGFETDAAELLERLG